MKPLNLLIICPDELRADCLGFMGNPDIRTPKIDSLANSSTIFPRHVASFPKCLPARISMMTGRYSHADGYRTIFQRMARGTPNLLSRLKDAGYQTALFGKNHCWDPEERKISFDYSSKELPYADEMKTVPSIRVSKPDPDGAQPMDLPPGFDYIGCHTRHAGDEAFTNQTRDFLCNRRDPERPFFLQLNLESPHPYYGVEEPWFSMYDRAAIQAWPHELPSGAPQATVRQREVRTMERADEAALREIQAVYYGMISKVDQQVGAVLDTVREQGLWDNTVIVFLSDHGDYAGQYGLAEKWDTCMTDCLVRAPLTIRAPGLPEGRRIDTMSDHTHLAPTLLELLGLPPLEAAHSGSLLPVVRGGKRIEVGFSEGGHDASMRARFNPDKSSPARVADPSKRLDEKQLLYKLYPGTMARTAMARTERFKLVLREDGDHEFYDLREDPWELQNLWHQDGFAAERAELLLQLAQWQLRTGYGGPPEQYFGA